MEETKVVYHDELVEHLSQGYSVRSYLSDGQYLIVKVSYCCEGEDVVLHQDQGSLHFLGRDVVSQGIRILVGVCPFCLGNQIDLRQVYYLGVQEYSLPP